MPQALKEQVAQVCHFAENRVDCRRLLQLRYLGEEAPEESSCPNGGGFACDNCNEKIPAVPHHVNIPARDLVDTGRWLQEHRRGRNKPGFVEKDAISCFTGTSHIFQQVFQVCLRSTFTAD
jgi:RecQ zinc-binding